MERKGGGEREGEEEEEEVVAEEAIEGKRGVGGARSGQATDMACRIAEQMCLRGSWKLHPDFIPYLPSSTKDILRMSHSQDILCVIGLEDILNSENVTLRIL